MCNFCGEAIRPGCGIMIMLNDGSTSWFCSSKCRKNATKLKRNPKRFKWTSIGRRKGAR